MTRSIKSRLVVAAALSVASLLSACGGGGGSGAAGSGNPEPLPAVTLTPSASKVVGGQNVTLSWSTSNATSCTASGGWTGTKATAGSEEVGPINGATTFTLTCTGPGGQRATDVSVGIIAPPTISFSIAPSQVFAGEPATLKWSAGDATACSASGAWTGNRNVMGEASTGLLTAGATYQLSCSGEGGTSSKDVAVAVSQPPATTVIVSGQITFDRPPFKSSGTGGLDMSNANPQPARGIAVEALSPSTTVLASTTTDPGGFYAFEMPTQTDISLRAKAQMQSTTSPTFNFRVLNNANSDALYVLDGSVFSTGSGPNVIRNLNAPTGWNGVSYIDTDRAAAPFAILDTAYDVKTLILGAAPTQNLPALDLYWSVKNKTATGTGGCTDADNGNIGTSFYTTGADPSCPALPAGIYILGDYANGGGDTDEFDDHVIAHEMGHYFEDKFSRSDSQGGDHAPTDRLDLRVAFSEGWGDAFSGMATNDPIYRDSQNGVSTNFNFNVENDTAPDGWFSEGSVAEILWDIFDPANEPGDTVELGFTPIYNVMTSTEKNTDALTSIFPFIASLRASNAAQSAAIGTLLTSESINGTDDFGSGETHAGGDTSVLPIYPTIAPNDAPVNVCSTVLNGSDSANKLGNHKFFRFTLNSSATLSLSVTGAADPTNLASVAATDPDVYVFHRGNFEAVGNDTGATETISQHPFSAGTYIIDVYDYDVQGTAPRCMTLSLQGG